MPHFNFSNIESKKVKQLCQDLTPELAKDIECPQDWITFNHIEGQTFVQGGANEETVFVNVQWFQRSQKVQDQIATKIHNALIKQGFQEVVIIFHELKKENYYEEGEHF